MNRPTTPPTDDDTPAEASTAAANPPEATPEPADWSIEDAIKAANPAAATPAPANPGDDTDANDLSNEDHSAAEGRSGAGDAAPGAADGGETGNNEKPAEKQAPGAAQDDEGDNDLTDDALARLKPREAVKRIQKLAGANRELREQLATLTAEHQPAIEIGRPVHAFMQQNDLSNENLVELLKIGALLRRGDYTGFAEAVQPYLDTARQATGQTLPADLQAQVDDGYITAELAAELARARHGVQAAATRLEDHQRRAKQETAQRQTNTVRDTLNGWEARIQAADPDYQQLRPAVHEQVQLEIQARGVPETAAAAEALAQRALDRVRALAVPAARRQATPARPRAATSGSNQTAGAASGAPPSTLDEAIAQGLAAVAGRG